MGFAGRSGDAIELRQLAQVVATRPAVQHHLRLALSLIHVRPRSQFCR